jgi:hypothetical protein
VDNRPQVDFFCGDERKPFPQVEARLRTENSKGTGAGPVMARTPLLEDHFEKAMVFLHARFLAQE